MVIVRSATASLTHLLSTRSSFALAVFVLLALYLLGAQWRKDTREAESTAARYSEKYKLSHNNLDMLIAGRDALEVQLAEIKREIQLQRDSRDDMMRTREELRFSVAKANQTVVDLGRSLHTLQLHVEDVNFQERTNRKRLEQRHANVAQGLRDEISNWRKKLHEFFEHMHAPPQSKEDLKLEEQEEAAPGEVLDGMSFN